MNPATTNQGTQTSTTTAIDPATQVGFLSLTVADLDRSIAFYTAGFGFALLAREGSQATLGVGEQPLLHLQEHAGAAPWPQDRFGHTGLYHFAILVPSRADLGRWLRHWLEAGFPMPGQGDHLVSEALYISDPDQNGIEIYRDRPRADWQWVAGKVQMASDPVDLRGVIAAGDQANLPWTGLPAGTRLGHMHLQVGDIPQAATFYHDILGFDIVAAMPSALFVSAGGYHHHLGLNTWHSKGATPAPDGTAGLRYFTIELPSQASRAAVIARVQAAGLPVADQDALVTLHDPWSNRIILTVGAANQATVAQGNTPN